MPAAPIDFNPETMEMTVGPWRLPLSTLERLWLVVAVFPGMPDEREQRWVLQTRSDVVLAPALHLPTPRHVQALAAWGQAHQSLFVLERAGWPWSWRGWRWAWRAMSGGCDRFDLGVWQAVQADAEISGPCALQTMLGAG